MRLHEENGDQEMGDLPSVPASPEDDVTGHTDHGGVQSLRRLLALEETVRRASQSASAWWVRIRSIAETAVTEVALDELVIEVLAAIRDLLEADSVAMLVANEAGDALVARGSIGLPDSAIGGVHIPAGSGMAGRVLATRQPMVVNDLSTIEGVAEALRNSGAQSLVAVPMLASDGSVLGVLHADSFQLGRYRQEDADVLQLVADHLSAAIERVRLFEAERAARSRAELLARRLGRLQRITTAMSRDLDIDELADVILTDVASDLGEGVVSRTLWLKEEAVLSLYASGGTEGGAPAFAEIPLDADLPGPIVIRTGENMWITSRAELEARFPVLKESFGVAGALCVLPLVTQGEARGALVLGFETEQPFDDDQRSFLSVVALETAQALNRHWLHEAQAVIAARSAFLAEASAALASSLDVPATLRSVVHLMVPDVADIATLHLFDDSGTLRRVELAHRDPEIERVAAAFNDLHDYEARSALAVIAAAQGRALLLPSAGTDVAAEVALDEGHGAMIEGLGIRSVIAVPLVVRGQTLGLLGLMRLRGSPPYVEGDLHFVEELGRRAAVSIENSRAHQRRVDVARELQASLLPPSDIEVAGLDVAAAFHPAGEGMEVGGDFYDVFPLGDGVVFMIGDVSGSGPAAAGLTAQIRHGARVAARAGLDPAEVIALVNASMDETTSAEWFCTMIYAHWQLDAAGAEIQIICAGHPSPLIVRDGSVEELDHHGPLLGVLPLATFEARTVRLGPGHAMVFVTDGAIEARAATPEPDTAEFFGTERLTAVVAAVSGQPSEVIVKSITDAVLEFAGGELSDDMAILVIKVEPRSSGKAN